MTDNQTFFDYAVPSGPFEDGSEIVLANRIGFAADGHVDAIMRYRLATDTEPCQMAIVQYGDGLLVQLPGYSRRHNLALQAEDGWEIQWLHPRLAVTTADVFLIVAPWLHGNWYRVDSAIPEGGLFVNDLIMGAARYAVPDCSINAGYTFQFPESVPGDATVAYAVDVIFSPNS